MLNKSLIGLLMVILLSSETLASSGWLIYHERAYKGRVIDSETKEPIEGAVVVAIYNVRTFGPILPIFSGTTTADVQETMTDKQGNFNIPSNIFFYPWPTTFGGDTTTFIIFKPGYGSFPHYRTYPPLKLSNPALEQFFSGDVGKEGVVIWHAEVDKVTFGIVELPKLKTREERLKANPSGPVGEKSDWKKQKQFIKAIRQEWQYLYNEDPGNLYKIEGESK